MQINCEQIIIFCEQSQVGVGVILEEGQVECFTLCETRCGTGDENPREQKTRTSRERKQITARAHWGWLATNRQKH